MAARANLEYEDESDDSEPEWDGEETEEADEGEEEEEEEDDEDEDPTPATRRPDKLPQQRQQKKQRKAPVPRVMIDEAEVVLMVKGYRIEFATYCRGKKQAPKQLIPGKVWDKIYEKYYLPAFPTSTVDEETLKKHLKEQLQSMSTGIADDGQTPVLQDEELANEIRRTDTAATRNILRMRQGFVGGVAMPQAPSPARTASAPPVLSSAPSTPAPTSRATGQQTAPAPPTVAAALPAVVATLPATSQHLAVQTQTTTTGSSADSHRLTKSEMLNKQSEAICSIAKDFHQSAEKQAMAAEKHALLIETKTAKHQAALLMLAKEHGVLDEQEFKEKLRQLIHL
ncbi:unnamed protein product [Calypogeia fissa]